MGNRIIHSLGDSQTSENVANINNLNAALSVKPDVISVVLRDGLQYMNENRNKGDIGVYFARVPSVVRNVEKEDHTGFQRLVKTILQTTFWRMTVFVEGTLFFVRQP